MAKRRARRTRSPHPGVKLLRREREGVATHYARFTDPDTGKLRDENLSKLLLTAEPARVEWAKRKAVALAERRRELALGAPRHTGGTVSAALDEFLATIMNPATLATYREGVERFRSWAAERGLATADEVHAHHLAQFREWLRTQPRQRAAKGAGRGKRTPEEKRIKATSVNNRLRSVKACLNWLREQGKLAHVGRDDIRERLKALPADEDPPTFLRPEQIRQLLRAVLAHDGERFEVTRAERQERGTTPRYPAIGPFLLAALLGGFREGELHRLLWDMVDLDALDEHGARVGEIRLPGSVTKTGRGRTVDLGVSPALRRLLIAWRLRTGGKGFVFGGDKPWSRGQVEAARKRLVAPIPEKREAPRTRGQRGRRTGDGFGAPRFAWQELRSTCATFLTNAPGIFGASAAHRSAAQLGHRVDVAERYYLGLVRGISREAHDVETAMGVADLAEEIVRATNGGRPVVEVVERAKLEEVAG